MNPITMLLAFSEIKKAQFVWKKWSQDKLNKLKYMKLIWKSRRGTHLKSWLVKRIYKFGLKQVTFI
jgi:hypothetical protein